MLKTAYGDSYLDDYADNPADPLSQRTLDPDRYMSRTLQMPSGVLCIHGHFHPGKYRASGEEVLFTMLRHPIANMISIYWFWKTLQCSSDSLHSYFISNQLTVIEMAQLPLLRHLFTETYFGGFDMQRFNLIGAHETRQAALSKLSELIEVPLKVQAHENITPQITERHEMEADPVIRRDLEDILSADIEFYERFVT